VTNPVAHASVSRIISAHDDSKKIFLDNLAIATPTAVRIGERIRAARLQRGFTQAALGKKLGVPYQLVQRYERGEKLTLARLVTIAEVLKVDPYSLVDHTASSAPAHNRRRSNSAAAQRQP
jgi:ribosome-binding protein aMBF1 (putative translation factor)